MKRKLVITLAFVLLLITTAFSAFAAENIKLQVNGDVAPSPSLTLVDDVSMIPVDTYISLAGADVSWTSDSDFAITENGVTLNLSLGKKEAMLGNSPLELPVEPYKTEEGVFIPLRAVSSSFDFEVGWDGEQRLVTLTRNETRDGMTVSDLLVKSSVAANVYNTYSMEGLFNIAMDITADGKDIEDAPKNITSKLIGQMQNEPFQAYMKQALDMSVEEIPEMIVETYLTQEKIYIKAPGQDWIAQDMPFSPEFWKEQQDIQSDPMKAAAQMKEMGILLNFGNDVTVNGENYYVVNATMDMEKFMQGYQNVIQQAMGMTQQMDSEMQEEMQQQILEIFNNARMDYSYSVLVNKKTLISDIVNFNIRLELTMENPEPAEDQEQNGDTTKEIKLDMNMNGKIAISGLDGPFNVPDVSAAGEMTTQPQQIN